MEKLEKLKRLSVIALALVFYTTIFVTGYYIGQRSVLSNLAESGSLQQTCESEPLCRLCVVLMLLMTFSGVFIQIKRGIQALLNGTKEG